MRFAYPYLLFLEVLVPLLAGFFLFVFYKKRKDMEAFGQERLIDRISSASANKRKLKALLVLCAVFFITLAIARPQLGTKLVEVKQKGADVVICVDVSTSMLAEDLKPNRLDKAKYLLSTLVQQLNGNRVGIIAFAGTAFWQCPLTLDISSANMFLQIMDANLIPLPGTTIGNAIRLAAKGLEKTSPKSKAIVLLTDGEDHNGDPQGAASEAAGQGIKIYTIGFGNPAGEPIPVRDAQGNFSGYKKDKKGEVIMSKLDETLLSKISSDTGGEYFRAADGNVDIVRLLDDIQGLEKKKLSSNLNREYEDRYQYPLFLGFILLLAEFLIPATKRKS